MRNYQKLYFALLAGTILSTPANYAAAATITPILDTIKAEAADISGSYKLDELSGDLPEGAAEVEISGVKYYFTPSGTDAALLKTLAGTSAGNLTEDENGIFELNGKKYSFNSAAIPTSAFIYTDGTESDYNFTVEEADAEGNLTTKYYKVVLKPETFSTSESIEWSTSEPTAGDITGSMEINLPNNKKQTFYYTYTKPEGYDVITEEPKKLETDRSESIKLGLGINNTEEDYGNIESSVFIGNRIEGNSSATSKTGMDSFIVSGGIIYNTGNIDDVKADFVDNQVNVTGAESSQYVYGGVIYNQGSIGDIYGDFVNNSAVASSEEYFAYVAGSAINNSGGTIGNITGDFVGNYAEEAGAVYNSTSTIGNITGDFIGNNSRSYGGAVYNFNNSTIGNITGDFIGNYIIHDATSYALSYEFGGAISNYNSTIGDITGDFIGNYSIDEEKKASMAGAISNNGIDGIIGNITGDFIGNYSVNSGGAIQNHGTIGNITGDFIGNYLLGGETGSLGGAITNNGGTIGNITGDFIGNHIGSETTPQAIGGAITNSAGTIGNITGDFINNSSMGAQTMGGALAIVSSKSMGTITGNFINNSAISKGTYALVEMPQTMAAGGAIFTVALGAGFSEISENATVHYTVSYNGETIELYEPAKDGDEDTYMLHVNATVETEEEFNELKQNEGYVVYAQIMNVSPDDVTYEGYLNWAVKYAGLSVEEKEEALLEWEQVSAEEQKEIIDSFKQAVVEIQEEINRAKQVGELFKPLYALYNSSFLNNKAESEEGEAFGGAIAGTGIQIVADNYTSVFDGNTANGESNAIGVLGISDLMSLMLTGGYESNIQYDFSSIIDLTFSTINNGIILLNDGIGDASAAFVAAAGIPVTSVSGYGLAFTGDKGIDEESLRTTQYIKLNNRLAKAGNISIDSTTLSFGEGPYGRGEITADGDPITKVSLQNAVFDLYNKYQDTVNLKGWKATDSYLHVDVDVDNLTADVLNINGDVEGQTKVVVYASSEKAIIGKSILFATATGNGAEDSFTVYRVYNSPYMFDVDYNPDGENGKEWSLTMNNEENEYAGILPKPLGTPEVPDVDVPDVDIPDIDIPDVDIDIPTAPVYGEVVAYGALPAAALEQTRNMVDNIGNQIKNGRVYTRSCSFVDGYWDGEPYYNLWVNPTYYTSNIDSPFAIDADIWGIEAGGDIQHDVHNRLGIFVSYRQGEYDMNGNGDKYRSPVGSEIDIDSYLAGLYYRYDNNNWYAFATLYGGIQEADIKTDDGMKSDTDGVEFGASAEVGYDYALTDSVTLTPELGVFYTQVNYDDATDNMGKSASYDDARQIELETGVKLAKTFMTDESFANVYVKPSVVQTIVDGEDVSITGLGDVEALDDATLGRIEIGGRYGFTTNLSAYGWANYTFGSDYDATTFGLGLNYAF